MKLTENSSEKSGWRIKTIPFRDDYKMMKTNWSAVYGALLFFVGVYAGLQEQELFYISVFGLVIMLVSTFVRGRNDRSNWKKVTSKCIDREMKRTLGKRSLNGGVSHVWIFQLLCEFEMDGNQYTVTPGYWTTFISESSLQTFLKKVISPDGKCQLWVNPENPLQTELIANDIKDFLMHTTNSI